MQTNRSSDLSTVSTALLSGYADEASKNNFLNSKCWSKNGAAEMSISGKIQLDLCP